ncbi:MAG TPA: SMP-30/gluconolactonase/LRE family protein, partial [Pseudonocardia sp.]|nr:SMP-30/gluconolactonase/LRE family protein [Pseudonocardia sp.]
MRKPEVVLTDLAFGESPRWHDGRLWFANWGTGEVLAVDLGGRGEVVAQLPAPTIPISLDPLPDGRMLVVDGPNAALLRREPDGSLVRHADLSGVGEMFNEIVVDARGNAYVNGGSSDFSEPSIIALVTPDGGV